jgi:TolB protein
MHVLRSLSGCLIAAVVAAGCTSNPAGQPPADGQTQTARSDGAELFYAPSLPASAQNPSYSPDGTTLVFTLFHGGYNTGPAGLYLLDLARGAVVALLDEPDRDAVNLPGSVWDAAAERVAFSSDRRDDLAEIWTIDVATREVRRVTDHTALNGIYFFTEPSFFPDGQWIVFEADLGEPDDNQRGSIWKTRADGSDWRVLTDGPGGTDDRQPNWSPRGDRILFQRRAAGSDEWHIYTMTADGTDIQQVTSEPGDNTDASWSPNGRWIVYSSDAGGLPHPSIFAISAEGGTPVRITFDDEHEDGAPTWSTAGEWITFESHTTGAEQSATVLMRVRVPAEVGAQMESNE